jgi:hypothetical protein
MAIKIERRFFMSVTVDAPEGIFLPANYPELITRSFRLGQSALPQPHQPLSAQLQGHHGASQKVQ